MEFLHYPVISKNSWNNKRGVNKRIRDKFAKNVEEQRKWEIYQWIHSWEADTKIRDRWIGSRSNTIFFLSICYYLLSRVFVIFLALNFLHVFLWMSEIFFFRKRQWNTFEMWEVKSRGVAWKMLCNNGAVWRVPTRWVCLDIPTYMKGQWKKTYLLLSTSTTRFLPLLECRRYHRCR